MHMSKQTVTFSESRYPELIKALRVARCKKVDSFNQRMESAYQAYQRDYATLNWLQRWFFGFDRFDSIEEYMKKSGDYHFAKHFHRELIDNIDSMVKMLETNPPPDSITIDYDFWLKISKEQL